MKIKRILSLAATAAVAVSLAPAGAATTDTFRAQQWGLDRIQAEGAWAVSRGAGTTVAVVDTGVDLTHPDLAANLVTFPDADMVEPNGTCTKQPGKNGGRTCVQDGAQDKNGHGTHVAGIVAAVTDNGVGVAGVAPDAKVLPVRVLDAEGNGSSDQIAAGIRYAADKGAKVLNLSLGFMSGVGEVVKLTGELDPVYDAIDYAWSKGAVIVFAAGNDTVPLCAEPAAHSRVICVGSTDRNDLMSSFSNSDVTMSKYHVVAPGGDGLSCASDVLSTYLRGADNYCGDDGYESISGTSMAAPHVSGVAALLSAKGLSNQAIVDCILENSDDLGIPGRDPIFGYGRVNATKAVTNC